MIKTISANVLVFNNAGALALQLRAAHDDSYPLHWDFSAGGGIDEGERSEDAAARELKEEIGVKADVSFISEHSCIFPKWGTGKPKEDYTYLYKAVYEGNFSPDPNEVQEVRIFKLSDIEAMMKAGEKFHPAFQMLWDNGTVSGAAKI
jgi:isopentenyl-diphosphate Delta-isomerase